MHILFPPCNNLIANLNQPTANLNQLLEKLLLLVSSLNQLLEKSFLPVSFLNKEKAFLSKQSKYASDKVVYVADSRMFNEENLLKLEEHNFDHIVGARIKNLPIKTIKKYLKLYGHCDAKVALDEDKLAQAAI